MILKLFNNTGTANIKRQIVRVVRVFNNSRSEAWPIGSVFTSVVATNPATLLGYGTWASFAAGRALVGLDAGQTEFDAVEETGGAKTHTLTTAEMPSHDHGNSNASLTFGTAGPAEYYNGTSEAVRKTGLKGGGGSHNNLQPYIVVYFWKRTA